MNTKTGRFLHYSDLTLTVLLLAGAAVIIGIALIPGHPIIKAIALAYIVFP